MQLIAQHRTYFIVQNNDHGPRHAFLDDICIVIHVAQDDGHNMFLKVHGNDDMHFISLHEAVKNIAYMRPTLLSTEMPDLLLTTKTQAKA
jgi:hypothetical protein